MLYRTLLIGLGGTGVDVLRKFKTHHVRFTGEENSEHIRLLGIDTAVQQQGADDILSAEEFLQLASVPITLQMIRNYQDRPYFSWLRDMQLPAFSVAAGAGQRRLAGYLAYLWKGAEVRLRLEQAIDSLYRPQITNRLQGLADGGETRVFVVTSVCGGTGTGMYLDVSFMIDEIFRRKAWNAKKFGVLFTPGAFPQLANNIGTSTSVRANGYAALEELNYYMQTAYEGHEVPSPEPNSGSMSVGGAVFDLCFLIGGQNEQGQVVSQSLDLYRQTADFLFTAIAFPKISENLVQYFAVNEGGYAAVGSFTLPLPQALFVEKYLVKMGREMLNDVFAEEPEKELSVEGLLSATRFAEAEKPEQANLLRQAIGQLNQTVFVHGQPSNHDEADIAMREEARLTTEKEAHYRPQIQGEARQIATSILKQLEDQTDDLQRLNNGAIAQQIAFYRGVSDRIVSLNAVLGATGHADSVETLLSTALVRPGMFRKVSPEARVAAFRTALTGSFRASLLNLLKADLRRELNILRSDCDLRANALAHLIEDKEAAIAQFESYARTYLQKRRAADSSDRILETALADDLIPADRYAEERRAFLNACRAVIQLQDLINDNNSLNIPRFVETLYGVTDEWVSERVSLAESLDSDRFAAGLNRAWTSLQISESPESGVRTKNIVFAPDDPRIREQLLDRLKVWSGAAGSEPDFQVMPGTNVVTFLRMRGGFKLHEILEMDLLRAAYKLAIEDAQRAPFLKIPTHRRRTLNLENESQDQAKYFALALALDVIKPHGQNFVFGGGAQPLLLNDEPNPVKRRKAVRKLMSNPDYVGSIQRRINQAIEAGGNDGYKRILDGRLQELYGSLSDDLELKRMQEEESAQLRSYCQSL